jgi:hypothetical protein
VKARTILIKALANATGKSEAEVELIAGLLPVPIPDKDIPDDEAERLLEGLYSEAPGILAWLVEGAAQFRAKHLENR